MLKLPRTILNSYPCYDKWKGWVDHQYQQLWVPKQIFGLLCSLFQQFLQNVQARTSNQLQVFALEQEHHAEAMPAIRRICIILPLNLVVWNSQKYYPWPASSAWCLWWIIFFSPRPENATTNAVDQNQIDYRWLVFIWSNKLINVGLQWFSTAIENTQTIIADL